MNTVDLSSIKFHLISKEVYFAFQNTNNTWVCGRKILDSIVFNEHGYYYRIKNYNNLQFGEVFENKEELSKFIFDHIDDI